MDSMTTLSQKRSDYFYTSPPESYSDLNPPRLTSLQGRNVSREWSIARLQKDGTNKGLYSLIAPPPPLSPPPLYFGMNAPPPLPPISNQLALVVRGFGAGHGVGMSQWGAHAMAKNGASYRKILTHYYRGVDIVPFSSR